MGNAPTDENSAKGLTAVTDDGNATITPLEVDSATGRLKCTATLSDVAVSNLADGTDGELITWDSSGVATTVSVGISGQVLTSNGAGAAPTFQTISGGASTALDNLASVAINTSLISDTDVTDDLGSVSIAWKDLYHVTSIFLGATSGDTTVQATAVAGTTTLTLPAATDTLVGKATTDTLTNKTIDANGTGNSITNIDTADIAAATLVTEADTIASNDNDTTWPTSAAVKDYADLSLAVDGTTGRILRTFAVIIRDGTNASTLKVSTSSQFNGDTISVVDNVAKSATTSGFTLNAGGTQLTIEASIMSGDTLAVLGNYIGLNDTGTVITTDVQVISNDIQIGFRDASAGTQLDSTSIIDTSKSLNVFISYITDA
jgi:hypothetical protein|tara:strand:- start:137 stop:1261 length:1125 start_codon:yes stop_codon:yes gene_type:complete